MDRRAFEIALDAQHRHDVTISPEKRAAKSRAADIMMSLVLQPGMRLLDVGGEEWYADYFPPMDRMNLPDDMHSLSSYQGTYDAILAMHVLEHSPFPLLVLLNFHAALNPGGYLYIAVPQAVEPFLTLPSHFTVLARENWEKLFTHAGFKVSFHETGRFGNYDPAIEERFVCIKQP